MIMILMSMMSMNMTIDDVREQINIKGKSSPPSEKLLFGQHTFSF